MDGFCASMSTVCDGKLDCENGRDEDHCSKWFNTPYKDFILANNQNLCDFSDGWCMLTPFKKRLSWTVDCNWFQSIAEYVWVLDTKIHVISD